LRPHRPTPTRSVHSHAPRGVYAPHIVCEARTVHIRSGPGSTLAPRLGAPARYTPPESPLNAARLGAGGLGRGRATTLRRGFRAAFTGANQSCYTRLCCLLQYIKISITEGGKRGTPLTTPKRSPLRTRGVSRTRSGICCAGSSTGIQSRQQTARSARMATAAQPRAEAKEPGPRDAASIA
jgi:hypothetical protein